MPLWGNVDNANNQPKYDYALARTGPLGSGNAAEAANNTALFNNVSPGVFGSNSVVGAFAVTGQEFANTSATEWAYPAHLGWHMRIAGMGPVTSIAASPGGTGYSNTDTLLASNGSINATATLTTNATGGITAVTMTAGGMFPNASIVAIAAKAANGSASAGSGATFTPTMGGRAGRLQYECVVAMGSITGTANTIPG